MWRPYIVAPACVGGALLLSAGMQSASLSLTSPASPPATSAPTASPVPPPPLPVRSPDIRSTK